MGRKIRLGDTVQVITGADRGKQGAVIGVDGDRVRVESVRIQKVHMKPGRRAMRGGGILEREGKIHISNVMLVDPDSSQPSRVRTPRDESGQRQRVFAKSGKPVPEPGR